jgi:hypothetical protein
MMSAQRLQKYAAPTISITGGFIWEAIEVAHTLEYIRHLIERPELHQLVGLAGHLPPLAVLGLGLLWAFIRHTQRESPPLAVVNEQGNVVEMIVRERTTTTTEREFIFRRTS